MQSKHTLPAILKNSTVLRAMLSKTEQLAKLNQAVKQYLEPSLAANCQVANLTQGRLILATTSAAWKHCLRFILPDLLSELRKEPEWCSLIAIESFVQPVELDKYSQPAIDCAVTKLSVSSSKLLIDTAANLQSEPLAAALIKLAKHTQLDHKGN